MHDENADDGHHYIVRNKRNRNWVKTDGLKN